MHVLRLLRIFVPLLIVAALVAGTVLVLSSRADLQRARKDVDTDWSRLHAALDARYATLAAANNAVRTVPGPLHDLVAQVATAYTRWRDLEAHNAGVTSEVVAANTLEALGRRLVLAAHATPRLRGDTSALAGLDAFAALAPPAVAGPFDAAVSRFERARNRPSRSVAARVLGYGSIPAYDASGSG